MENKEKESKLSALKTKIQVWSSDIEDCLRVKGINTEAPDDEWHDEVDNEMVRLYLMCKIL